MLLESINRLLKDCRFGNGFQVTTKNVSHVSKMCVKHKSCDRTFKFLRVHWFKFPNAEYFTKLSMEMQHFRFEPFNLNLI